MVTEGEVLHDGGKDVHAGTLQRLDREPLYHLHYFSSLVAFGSVRISAGDRHGHGHRHGRRHGRRHGQR